MKISIIIPVYNVEKYIAKCLDSIINQTYTDIEIICVNDGSPDNSTNIIKEYQKNDSRIILLEQCNKGLASARNTGLLNATGDYVYFCDSDDWIDENLIKHAYENAIKYNSDIVIFDFNNVYNKSIIPVNRVGTFLKKYNQISFYFNENKNIVYQNPSACAKLYKKYFLQENELKFPEQIRYGEDSPFWLQLLFCNPKISLLNECLYYYRKREGGLTTKTNDFVENQWNAYLEVEKMLNSTNESLENCLYALDFECRLAVYSYSAINNIKYFLVYEKSIKNFRNKYKSFKNYNLLTYKGFFLYKFRHFYTIGKKVVLFLLKLKGKKNV